MQVFGLNAGFARLAKYTNEEAEHLSTKAWFKHRVLDLVRSSGGDVHLACEHYGVSRATVYRWKAQFKPRSLKSLEERSRRPHRVRHGEWSRELERTVKQLREQYGWGKDKLVVLVRREGLHTSASTVGRILTSLKRRGLLSEPEKKSVRTRRRITNRPHAERKPKDWPVESPGDLVQVDTVDLNRHLSEHRKQFTARDTISRWDVIEAHTRATSGLAAQFLDTLQSQSPYPIKAIQVDGAASSPVSLSRSASDVTFDCSPYHRVVLSSTVGSNEPSAPTGRSTTNATQFHSQLPSTTETSTDGSRSTTLFALTRRSSNEPHCRFFRISVSSRKSLRPLVCLKCPERVQSVDAKPKLCADCQWLRRRLAGWWSQEDEGTGSRGR